MKKSILIVSDSLSMGGLEKCLINFCDNIDYKKYDVDLYLFNDGRELLDKLNKKVNLLPNSPLYSTLYNVGFSKSIKTLLKNKQFSLALYRINRFIRARFKCKKFTKTDWKNMQKSMLKIDKKYDIAIGFAEGCSSYYVADCVKADRKICWVHTDLNLGAISHKLDEQAFSKVDYVCAVSNRVKGVLEKLHPNFKDKYRVYYLTTLYDLEKLNELSNEQNEIQKENCTKILSVGRLVELKGFHLCVEPLKRLIDEGYNVKWFVLGDGPDRQLIENVIVKYGVKDKFILLGNQANPYKYMKCSNICVQPSLFEGMSLVIYEEKLFNNAIVLTDVGGNKEMITDNVNGVFCERNSQDIYNKLKYLLDNKELTNKMAKVSANNYSSNSEIMAKIEEMFN